MATRPALIPTEELVQKYEDQTKRHKISNPKNVETRAIQWSKILKTDITETLGTRTGAWGYPISVYTVRMVNAMRARAFKRGYRLRCVSDLASDEFVVWLERKNPASTKPNGR